MLTDAITICCLLILPLMSIVKVVKFSSLRKTKIQKDPHSVDIVSLLEKSSWLKEMCSFYY